MADWIAYGSIALGAAIAATAVVRFVVDIARSRKEGDVAPGSPIVQKGTPAPSGRTSVVQLVITDAVGTILIVFGLFRLFV